MKIAITGSEGFVGKHLCAYFASYDHDIVHIDRTLGIDVTDPYQMEKILISDIDAVIHLAAQVKIDEAIKKPVATYNINVHGTMCVLEAIRQAGINKILFASTADVYGNAQMATTNEYQPLLSTNPYGASKIAAERLCFAYGETYGIKVGILRCFNIYGPGQVAGVVPIFIKKALKGETLTIHGTGYQSRDYVYIDDIMRAYDMMLHKDVHDAVNFGTGLKTSIRDLAEMILCTTGSLSKIEYTGVEERSTFDLTADIQKARQLGWIPKISLKNGIKWCMEALQ